MKQAAELCRVLLTFLWLGCISFGGPAAHTGIFQREFVQRRQWLSQAEFARLLALVQFLPGPASSQLGFAIGRQRAGLPGAVAAFIGFTLPSATLMLLLALGLLGGLDERFPWLDGVLLGLKWLAVVVVADAVLTMHRHFCTDFLTRMVALAMAAVTLTQGPEALWGLLAALLLGAWLGSPQVPADERPQAPLTLLRSLLWLLPFLPLSLLAWTDWSLSGLWSGFFYSGSLVFGGGHVVLPLLQQQFQQQLPADTLLAGYAFAQAMPGPLFSMATYLGAMLLPLQPLTGALLATLGVFVPGFLLLLALQPYWSWLSRYSRVQGAIGTVNAAVTGLLAATLINPVLISAGLWSFTGWKILLPGLLMLAAVMALRWMRYPVSVLVLVVVMAVAGVLFRFTTVS